MSHEEKKFITTKKIANGDQNKKNKKDIWWILSWSPSNSPYQKKILLKFNNIINLNFNQIINKYILLIVNVNFFYNI